MKTITSKTRLPRHGAIAFTVGLLLVVIVGMIAFAFDSGWIALTRVQVHAAADSGALAGGTELLPGLGFNATATPSEVQTAATLAAVEFAGRNRGGDRDSCYCDGGRDVIMGTAVFDPDTGQWIKTPGATPYNYVQVNLHRDQQGSTAGDGTLPLFFARIFAIPDAPVSAYATAVILPANGFFIEEGSEDTAGLMPFAFREVIWRRLERAQDYYDANPGVLSQSKESIGQILDVEGADPTQPLFGQSRIETSIEAGGVEVENEVFEQLFFDDFIVPDPGLPFAGADGLLELSVYPGREPDPESTGGQGNFGTVDFGATDNSTQTLKRQIVEGLNADDLSYYEDNQFSISEIDLLDAEGDTGLSAGIQSSLESILGECRAVVLFTSTNDGSGNNYIYTLIEIVGSTVVEVDLTGGPANYRLVIQRCKYVDNNAIADTDEEIGENTTVFTPLILIE